MGSTYGFWRQLRKEQKRAKQSYIHMFYSLLFRTLVGWIIDHMYSIYMHAVRLLILFQIYMIDFQSQSIIN